MNIDNQQYTTLTCYVKLLAKQRRHWGVTTLHSISEAPICKVVYLLFSERIVIMGKANRIRDVWVMINVILIKNPIL